MNMMLYWNLTLRVGVREEQFWSHVPESQHYRTDEPDLTVQLKWGRIEWGNVLWLGRYYQKLSLKIPPY